MKQSLYVAGHIVIDEVIDKKDNKPRVSLGGPVSYSSISLKSEGYGCIPVTKVGNDFPKKYESFLRKYGAIDLSSCRTKDFETTKFRIDRTISPRRMKVLAKCESLSATDFQNASFQKDAFSDHSVILNPVVGEISSALIGWSCKHFGNVLIDSQGFVRRIRWDGLVSLATGLNISELKGARVLKGDSSEISGWSGIEDVEASIKLLSKYVEIILLTSGPDVVSLYNKGKMVFRARPFSVKVSDTTGAGDILLSSFAARFVESADIEDALRFSVSSASLSVQKYGIEKALLDRKRVEDSMPMVRITR